MRVFTGIIGLIAIYCSLHADILMAQGMPASSRKIVLPGGSARASSTPGIEAATLTGYAKISKASGSSIYGTSVLSYAPSGVVIAEVGVPPSPPTLSARIFIDYRFGPPYAVNTGVGIANAGTAAARITYTLRDLSAREIGTGHGTLVAGAHNAAFIDGFNDLAPDLVLPPDFASKTQFGSLEIASDQPVSIIALRMTTNQNNEVRFTTTPVADLSLMPGSGLIYFPQFVNGGGYTTTVILLNTSNAPESGELRIRDNNGNLLAVNTEEGKTGSVFRYDIPPAGGYVLRTDGSPNAATAGWVILTPDAGNSTPVGAGIFSFSQNGVLVTEAGVPSSDPLTHARVYVDTSGGRNTGIAFANPTGAPVNVVFEAFETDGRTIAGTGSSHPLEPNGHDAAFADTLITGLPAGFKGELEISCSTPIVTLALRSLYNSNNEFLITTFPIADVDRLPAMPVIFPQIADGGGYTTEIISLSTTGASSVTVELFGNDGSPLQVPLSLSVATGPYGIEFVMLSSGEFLMGSDNHYDNEKPVHRVAISQFFELGEYEITQGQWQTIMGNNPSTFASNPNNPLETVSWNDIQGFIAKLNLLNDGYQYRLPTEAEWEYACRAGTTGDWAGNLDEIAWYSTDTAHQLMQTFPVGTKLPNAWGLYDMHGNVMEWVQDWFDENYYSVSPAVDPIGPNTSSSNPGRRSIRGGSYGNHQDGNRSAARHNATPDTRTQIVGFRVMRVKR
jgi:formylglycine-generating enzyme required for sulfatase activity